MSAEYHRHQQLAIIRLTNPPVNGLSQATRQAIAEGLQKAWADPEVEFVVLTGSAKGFCGGADIREFNSPAASASPTLHEVIAQLESAQKPVIALLHGLALGGGLELALACHYRLAQADKLIALPEVKLCLIPGAGGTQRLPRLIPFELAAAMIVSGQSYRASQLAPTGLFSALFEQQDGIAFTSNWLQQNLPDQRTRADLPQARHLAIAVADPQNLALGNLVQQAQDQIDAQLQSPALAPHAAWQALNTGRTQGFRAGLAQERKLFLHLVAGSESRALRSLFFAERELAKASLNQQPILQSFERCFTNWLEQHRQHFSDTLPETARALFALGYRLPAKLAESWPAAVRNSQANPELNAVVARQLRLLDLLIINCSLQLTAEYPAINPSLLEILAVQASGWPRHRGGPLFYASELNYPELVADLQVLAAKLPHHAPVLQHFAGI